MLSSSTTPKLGHDRDMTRGEREEEGKLTRLDGSEVNRHCPVDVAEYQARRTNAMM